MYAQTVLTALIAWPAIAAVGVLTAPARWAKHIALAGSLLELAISVPLWWVFQPAGGMQLQVDVPWIPSWGIHYAVGVDGISLFLILLTTFLMPLSILGSYSYITTRERAFYALLLVLTSGMIGVFVALDLFLFYIMWDVMLIPMYFIIGVWGGQNRLYAALKFFVYTFLGSLLMLVAILALVYLVAERTGVYSFSYFHLMGNVGELGTVAFWLFGAFFLAFAIKVPIFPFHTWLPDAHVEAPTAGSVILAAVLLKMGTYGFLRFALPLFPRVALHPAVQTAIVTLSLVGIIYGGLVAMVQPDFKKLIAYSSVAHLGFVMLGIWALTLQSVQGALMVMINHGISTGALFFLVGMLYERRHTRLIEAFGGIAKVVPLFAAVLTIVSLSSIGLPARARPRGGGAMNLDFQALDLSRTGDLLVALAPELVLTLAALLVLLVVAWRHRTPEDLRLAGWLTLAGLGAAGFAAWFLWWQAARAAGIRSEERRVGKAGRPGASAQA